MRKLNFEKVDELAIITLIDKPQNLLSFNILGLV